MNVNSNPLWHLTDPKQWWSELSPIDCDRIWHQSQNFSTSVACWNAYLNQLGLQVILPRFREEWHTAKPGLAVAHFASCWEVVNGFSIIVDQTRFIIIPSEAIDCSELRVPQEWIDIPNWAGDYYLALQINLDAGEVRVWGYATHEQFKARGRYDQGDRTYSLDETELITDLSALTIARQLCPQEPTRAMITPLPFLPLSQAESLLERLGNAANPIPRLSVPFPLWGALLAHSGWRQQLYQRRLGIAQPGSVRHWLQTTVSFVAQQLGWEKVNVHPSEVGARGVVTEDAVGTMLARSLTICDRPYELRLISQGDDADNVWRFELHPGILGTSIPAGFKLRLLTEDLQPFENNEDIALTPVDLLFVEVALAPGEGLVWEIEPSPDDFEREILRF